jgi:hypothetical protein
VFLVKNEKGGEFYKLLRPARNILCAKILTEEFGRF